MKDAHSISTRRAYGVQRVCRVWHRARSSVYARRQATTSRAPCRRRGPVGAAPDDVLAGHIRRLLEASPFHGEGYRKAWAKLRSRGSAPRRNGCVGDAGARPPGPAPRGPRARPEGARRHDHHRGPRCDVGHGHDGHSDRGRGARPSSSWPSITARPSASACLRPSAGPDLRPWSRSARASAPASARLARASPRAASSARPRSNYLADDFQQEVAFFGIESSPSFVREPEGNGVAERFIRTLKENLLWVRSFDTIEELRLALLEFKRTYNEQWMLEKYHYQSPAQVRRDFVGLDAAA